MRSVLLFVFNGDHGGGPKAHGKLMCGAVQHDSTHDIDDTFVPSAPPVARIPGAVAPAIGERIKAVAPRENLHLFSADGRKRIDL